MSGAAPSRLARFLDPDGRLRLGRVEADTVQPLVGDLLGETRPVGAPVALSAATLLAPVRPSKIIVVHQDGRLTLKPPSAVIDPGAAIRLPPGVQAAEGWPCLAAVLAGARGVLGATLLCDVVAPDRTALLGGGGHDTFCPIGPWIWPSARLADAVARVAAVLTLFPGDVVAVRTGAAQRLQAGVVSRVAMEGAVLENPVVESERE